MGYTSDVILKIGEEGKTVLAMYQLEHPKKWATLMEYWSDDIEFDNYKNGEKDCFRFFVATVKWYDGYEDVAAMNQFWNYVSSKEDVINTMKNYKENVQLDAVFIRMGEDNGDCCHEYVGEGYELAEVYRTIREY